jgi:hypothetical protein
VRFFVGGEDLSHQPLDQELPSSITSGDETFVVIGAMAGG